MTELAPVPALPQKDRVDKHPGRCVSLCVRAHTCTHLSNSHCLRKVNLTIFQSLGTLKLQVCRTSQGLKILELHTSNKVPELRKF